MIRPRDVSSTRAGTDQNMEGASVYKSGTSGGSQIDPRRPTARPHGTLNPNPIDILLIEGRNYSPAKFLDQIKMDFDQLYEEAGHRRRMMSVSAHDRISGTPQMVQAWDAFLRYVNEKPGVAFLRKDAIARWAVESPLTLRESETI